MEKEVDVITLSKKLTEQTNLEKCIWKDTSENNRFKLVLKNGSIEIHHFKPSELDFLTPEYYDISLFDNKGERYAAYKATQTEDNSFKVFSGLYRSVTNLLEKNRRRKMALLLEELEGPEDRQ